MSGAAASRSGAGARHAAAEHPVAGARDLAASRPSAGARHAEIAGAGFAGLTLATALARGGWSVRVHERSAAPRGGGAGIFLWENGLRTLAALGLEAEVLRRSHSAAAWQERDHLGADLGHRPFPLPGGLRMVTMTRSDLYAPLLRAAREAGVDLRTGSEVVGADPAGALLTAGAASGRAPAAPAVRRWPADLVVGADGISSRVREAVGLLRARRSFEELTIVRFTVPRERAPGRDSLWSDYSDHWNLAARRRVMVVPCNANDLYLLLAARAHDAAATARPLDGAVWAESFPLLAPLLRELPPAPHADRYEAVEVEAWSRGRVALVGDAAHAMPPTIGQGAGTAMTNALALAAALIAHAAPASAQAAPASAQIAPAPAQNAPAPAQNAPAPAQNAPAPAQNAPAPAQNAPAPAQNGPASAQAAPAPAQNAPRDDVRDVLAAWEAAERPITDATQEASIARLADLFPTPGVRRDSWGARPLDAAAR
ncbi:NAD(P)/FAD-dependent oxidoreductase [Conexibacter sp. CPCC 205706]|uniref:FAD-dependent oxidoreductase n=1 Tax=Conexibacter sp. CPCC 205706 TaxID=3064572 RepID=UPI002718687E|nr:NAD(P)/FAD-dependent oxidoreductase [Conexibacter sp. CPCC 205706]MDO8189312.1 NAD(P)/FAD-dependent oxidoreductase [Conexibacter sp. CPCC 205706]